jgi:hypothetical protein
MAYHHDKIRRLGIPLVQAMLRSAKNSKYTVKPQDIGVKESYLPNALILCNLSKTTPVTSPAARPTQLPTDLFTDFVEDKFGH